MSTRLNPDDLRGIEKRLSNRLEALAQQPRPGAAERVHAQVLTTAQRNGFGARLAAWAMAMPRRQSAMAAAVVVLAVAVGVGIGASGVFTARRGSAPVQPTAGSAVLTPAPGSSATPPAAEGYQQWDRADLPQPAGLGLGIPHDVVAFRGTLLIVGGAETGPCAGVPCVSETAAAVWRLKGGAWERQPDQPGLRAGAMASAVATTNRLLILGETTSSPRGTGEGLVWPELWTSTDGVTFTARDAPAQFTAIVAPGSGLAGFLAAAMTDAGPEIWSSADGLAWHREVGAATLGAGAIRRMRVVGGQVIAVGAETIQSGSGPLSYHGVIWTSTGGQLWTRMEPDALSASRVNDIAATGSRLIAVGSTGDLGFGLIWVSDDGGGSWRRVDGAKLLGSPIGAVSRVGNTFVAIGGVGSSGQPLLTSPNGDRWDPVPNQASLSGDVTMSAIAVDPATNDAYIAGWRGLGDRQAVVWRSTPPSPSPAPAASLPSSTLYTSLQRASIPDPSPQTFGGEAPRDVVAFKGGFIAVGGLVGTCCAGGYSPDTRGLVWLSSGGESWDLLPPQAALAHGYMASVAASDKLVVAVGHRSLPPTQPGIDVIGAATWWSSDGRIWHLVTGSPTFSWVTQQDGRFFAISRGGAIGDEVWSSVDGQAWRKSANVADLAYSHLLGITTSRVGIIAWGSTQAESANGLTKETGVVWISADGASWVTGAGDFADVVIEGVAASPAGRSAGLMAFGQRSDGRWAVWTSHEGATWTEADAPGTGEGAFLRAYATSRGFLLAGSEMGVGGSRLRLWSSTNGTQWSIVAADSEALRLPPGVVSEEITSFAEKAGGSVVAVGSISRSGLNGISAAWVILP